MDLMNCIFKKADWVLAIYVLLNSVFIWVFFFLYQMMSDYKVEKINDGMQEFYVDFRGLADQ